MLNNNFLWVTLCCLLVIASTAGWSVPLQVAVSVNAVALLIKLAREAVALYKASKGH